jgi:hypothetical protein
MVIKNLYINGCSFLTENKNKCETHAGREVAKQLCLNPLEHAAGGRGNDRIIAMTKEFFYSNPDAAKDTFVLIGWSSSLRKDFIVRGKPNKLDFLSLHTNKKYWKSIKFTDCARTNKQWQDEISLGSTLLLQHLMNILNLQDFFEMRNIKYCMYDALDNQWKARGSWRNLFQDKVNKDRFFGFNEINHFCFANKIGDIGVVAQEHWEKSLNCSDKKGKDQHPNRLGHELWADKLVAFIKEKDLL